MQISGVKYFALKWLIRSTTMANRRTGLLWVTTGSSQLKDYPNVRSLSISVGLCLLELIHTRHQSVPSYFKLGWQNFYFSMFKQLMLRNRNSKRRKKNEKTKDFFFSDSIRNVPKFYWNGDSIFIPFLFLLFFSPSLTFYVSNVHREWVWLMWNCLIP